MSRLREYIQHTIIKEWTKVYDEFGEDYTMICECMDPDILLKYIRNTDDPKHTKWSIRHMSRNPKLTIEHVKRNRDLDWNWISVTCNNGISGQDIFDNPDLPWDEEALQGCKSVPWEYVQAHPEIDWDHYYEVVLRDVPIAVVHADLRNPLWNQRWYTLLSTNNYLYKDELKKATPEVKEMARDIYRHILSDPLFQDDYTVLGYICRSSCFTWELFEQHPNINWPFDIFGNENLPLDKLLSLPRLDNFLLSYRMDITAQIIRDHPRIKWIWRPMAQKSVISLEDMAQLYEERNKDRSMHEAFAVHPDLTMEFIHQHPEIDWDHICFVNHKNMTPDVILKMLEEGKRVHACVCFNPNMTADLFRTLLPHIVPTDEMRVVVRGENKITMEDIKNNTDLPWDPMRVVERDDLDMDYVEEMIIPNIGSDKPGFEGFGWDELVFILQGHDNLTFQFACKYKELLKRIPTHDYEINNAGDIEVGAGALGLCAFGLERRRIALECIRKWSAASKIKRVFRTHYCYDPATPSGQRMMMRVMYEDNPLMLRRISEATDTRQCFIELMGHEPLKRRRQT